jgi:hypothetical protein
LYDLNEKNHQRGEKMTKELTIVLSLLAAHFLGDWFLQSRNMAKNKSVYFHALLEHLVAVTTCLSLLLLFFYNMGITPTFPVQKLFINAVLHGIIDWFGWSFYKRGKPTNFKYWEDKGFYDTIAIDQFLHITILFILFL